MIKIEYMYLLLADFLKYYAINDTVTRERSLSL